MNENEIMSILEHKNIHELYEYANTVKQSTLDVLAKDEILKKIDKRIEQLSGKSHMENGELDDWER